MLDPFVISPQSQKWPINAHWEGQRTLGRFRALYASSEIFPLAKTGGLADVSGALPDAVARKGVDVECIMPGYPSALDTVNTPETVYDLGDMDGDGPTRLLRGTNPNTGIPVWIVRNDQLFARKGGLYQDADGKDWPDNAQRFGLFCRAVVDGIRAEMAQGRSWSVLHCNEWQTGLLPLLVNQIRHRPRTLFTIHNLAYMGLFPAEDLSHLQLPADTHAPEGMEFYGQTSLLKAGIQFADWLSTVSPRYAQEIMSAEFGLGLEGLLSARRHELDGILNGIDDDAWNPATDPHLPATYSLKELSGKAVCKQELQKEFDLPVAPETPLIAYMSRLAWQKMPDVVYDAITELLSHDVDFQFILHAEGDSELEGRFRHLAEENIGKVSVRIGYRESVAHRLCAGADILAHPSRYEPCGLTQLYAMRYGTLPVVRHVGGLADTVRDDESPCSATTKPNGFVFDEPTATGLQTCLERAVDMYHQPLLWRRRVREAMQGDYGWHHAAKQYCELYGHITGTSVKPDKRRRRTSKRKKATPSLRQPA